MPSDGQFRSLNGAECRLQCSGLSVAESDSKLLTVTAPNSLLNVPGCAMPVRLTENVGGVAGSKSLIGTSCSGCDAL